MKKSKKPTTAVLNRRARFDYQLESELTVGMALTGPLVRSIRDRHVQLLGSFVAIKNGELWLNNLTVGSDTAPNIRLLATKAQIAALAREKTTGFTIVPTKLLPTSRHIKLVIALGRGKKSYDKRLTIKHRDLDRESRRYRS